MEQSKWEDLLCSICFDSFNDPRLLPCGHTYCFACIKRYSEGNRSGNKLPCPLCREESCLSNTDIEQLPKNYALLMLSCIRDDASYPRLKIDAPDLDTIDEYNCDTSEKVQRRFSPMSDGSADSTSEAFRSTRCVQHHQFNYELYCFDCYKALCYECYLCHGHKGHNCDDINKAVCMSIQQINEIDKNVNDYITKSEKLLMEAKKAYADFIEETQKAKYKINQWVEQLHYFINSQKERRINKLNSVEMKQKDRIKVLQKSTDEQSANMKRLRMRIKEIKETGSKRDVTEAASGLQERADKVLKLDTVEQQLTELADVHVKYTEPLNEVACRYLIPPLMGDLYTAGTHSGEVDEFITSSFVELKRPLSATAGPVKKPDEIEVTQEESTAQDRQSIAARLRSIVKSTATDEVSSADSDAATQWKPSIPRLAERGMSAVACQTIHVPAVTGMLSSIFRRHRDVTRRPVCRPTVFSLPTIAAVESTLKHTISPGKPVYAITSLGERVYVVRHKSSDVEIYEPPFLKINSVIAVNSPGRGDSFIAACNTNYCLYLSDYNNGKLLSISLLSHKFQTSAAVKGPRGLSLSTEQNLLVACPDTNKLKEYDRNLKLLRKIKLLGSVKSPWHAIHLSADEYVVSHGGPMGILSVVGKDGKLVRSYEQSGAPTGSIVKPRSIVATRRGKVLLADSGNNKIIAVDKLLTRPVQLILSASGDLQEPSALWLDESRNRLYVGEWSGGRVLVFDIALPW